MKNFFLALMFVAIVILMILGMIKTFAMIPMVDAAEANHEVVAVCHDDELVTTSERTDEASAKPELRKYFKVPLDLDIQDHIFELCEEYELDPALIMGIIRIESTFNVDNVGDGGASLGLMQVQPRWHRERMIELGCDNLMDPYQNLTVGIDYFAELLGSSGSVTWALMAYNGGPGYANDMASQGYVSGYALAVLSYARGYGY